MRSKVTRPADLGSIHDIGAPIHVYPLFENGFRAHRKQSIRANNHESAKLYGRFAKIAESNPYAWNYGKEVTEETIATVSKKNRMICFPCQSKEATPGSCWLTFGRSIANECF